MPVIRMNVLPAYSGCNEEGDCVYLQTLVSLSVVLPQSVLSPEK